MLKRHRVKNNTQVLIPEVSNWLDLSGVLVSTPFQSFLARYICDRNVGNSGHIKLNLLLYSLQARDSTNDIFPASPKSQPQHLCGPSVIKFTQPKSRKIPRLRRMPFNCGNSSPIISAISLFENLPPTLKDIFLTEVYLHS